MRALALSALLSMSPFSVQAHSLLEETTPADGTTVTGPVEEISLAFGDGVEAGFATVTLTRDGQAVALTPTVSVSEDGRRLIFGGVSLGTGKWVAEWSAISVDGHRVDGRFVFTVGQ
jgi:methionine-rich copper-binding protein CopC